MDEMMGRYFGVSIDKTLQTSFNLEDSISDAQYEYAALDTRTPLAIKAMQQIVANGETVASLLAKNKLALANRLKRLNSILLGDNLNAIIQIENDAIGAFADMQVHGERIVTGKWLTRTANKKLELAEVIVELDTYFLPIVGSKLEYSTDEEIAQLEVAWKTLTTASDAELKLKADIRKCKKVNPESDLITLLEADLAGLESSRKEAKDLIKAQCGDAKKKRTAVKTLASKCEGEALINYSSGAQLIKVLKESEKKLSKITSIDDETLEKFESIPVMKNLRLYAGLSKEVGTYGDAWTQQWKTGPCKAEGWLSPGDGRLHCEFNQYDAATGRSSSSKPNAQNLPKDPELRSCFIADDDDEYGERVLVTCDMSGAELRIIAEDANDDLWIGAFERKEDVHSVGAELLHAEEWTKLALPDCEYLKLNEKGVPQHFKCHCPEHQKLRDENKSTNFLLAYGGGPGKLSKEIKKTVKEARALMDLHRMKNPRIWDYLEDSGNRAKVEKKAIDMYGRRRLFPEPTWDLAREFAMVDKEKELRLPAAESDKNLSVFEQTKGRKPSSGEKWMLTHRLPNSKEISKAYQGMYGAIERQGKNHKIQSCNATIAKVAMGSASDDNGKLFLWGILPQYHARLQKFVHDELVISVPAIYAEQVAFEVQDAFKRAAAIKMKRVVMESEYHIGKCWKK
jgi:DNA polymerase I-like protein with 3'-5' exonuclease and polymerase domains